MQDKDNIFKKYINIRTMLSVVFVLAITILIAIIIAGSAINKEILTFSFWLKTGINVILVMIVHNYIKPTAILSELKGEEHQSNKKRYTALTDFVKQKFLQPKIEEATKQENKEREENALQSLLDNITYGITVEQAKEMTNEELEQISEKRMLSRRQKRKLKKAVIKVKNNQAKYEVVNANEILNYTSLNNDDGKHAQMSYDRAKENLQENLRKMITYTMWASALNIFLWEGLSPQFWITLLSQATLIMSSSYSAISYAKKRVEKLNHILNNRSDFISQAIKDDLLEYNNK